MIIKTWKDNNKVTKIAPNNIGIPKIRRRIDLAYSLLFSFYITAHMTNPMMALVAVKNKEIKNETKYL